MLHPATAHHRPALRRVVFGRSRSEVARSTSAGRKRRVQISSLLAKLLFFFSLVCLVTFPAILNLSSKFISDGGDLYLFAMKQVNEHIHDDIYPFSQVSTLRYPLGYNFGIGIDAVLGVLLGAGLLFIFPPVVSYNVSLLLLLSINALASYSCFRHIGKTRELGVLGAVCYGLSFYVLARGAGHLNLMFTAGFPLVTLAILKLRERHSSWQDVGLLYLGGVLLSWGSIQYAIMGVVLLVAAWCIGLLSWPAHTTTFARNMLKVWKLHLFFMSCALIAFLWSFGPTVQAIMAGQFIEREAKSVELFDISLHHFFSTDPFYITSLFAKLLPHNQQPNIEHAVFLGIAELILFGAFLVSRHPARLKLFVTSLLCIFLVFSLGVVEFGLPMPYRLLVDHFPFSALAEPGRFTAVITLILTAAGVLALAKVQPQGLQTGVVIFFIVFCVVERIPAGYFQADTHEGEYLKSIQSQPGRAVMNVPLSFYRQEYSLIPIYTNKSILDGYIHWSTNTEQSRSFIDDPEPDLKRFICQEGDTIFERLKNPTEYDKVVAEEQKKNKQLLISLKENNIRTMVLHKDADFFHKHCANVRARLNFLLDHTTTAQETSTVTQQITTVYNGKIEATLYFPQSGIFSLHGVAVSDPNAFIYATVDNSIVNLPDALKAERSGGIVYTTASQGKPYDEYRYFVTAGSSMRVFTDVVSELGSTTIWYDYQPISESTPVEKAKVFERIYTDDTKEVFSIY